MSATARFSLTARSACIQSSPYVQRARFLPFNLTTKRRSIAYLRSPPIFPVSASSSRHCLHQFVRTMATNIPKTMKGVVIEKEGGPEVLEYKTDLPVPEPKKNEILVKNDLVGINYIDTYFRSGLYKSKKPEILGREAEGTVIATGADGEGKFKVGDRVVWMHTGAYAEYTAVPLDNVFAVPASVERGQAAASILQGLTALAMTEESYQVKKGDWIIVHAAAGGVGQWLVRIIKAKGAHVIATAGTPEKRELVKKLGADEVTGYGRDILVGAMREKTDGKGVQAVFDGVGKDTFDLSLFTLARKGTMVSFGNASGAVPPVDITKLVPRNLKLIRPTLFGYLATDEERAKYSKELFDLLVKDQLKADIYKTYPLSQIADVHKDLEGRKSTGKLLVDPSK